MRSVQHVGALALIILLSACADWAPLGNYMSPPAESATHKAMAMCQIDKNSAIQGYPEEYDALVKKLVELQLDVDSKCQVTRLGPKLFRATSETVDGNHRQVLIQL